MNGSWQFLDIKLTLNGWGFSVTAEIEKGVVWFEKALSGSAY